MGEWYPIPDPPFWVYRADDHDPAATQHLPAHELDPSRMPPEREHAHGGDE